ncbi:MAG: glycosyltransferase, partial [Muribaculaceae bacterium]|nr:glycosyltransferase [Muribaculaceae bacterium]
MISIVTPTYNRALLLSRLYESLKAQSCHDFEWIIVDDGSTDNTT